MVATRAAERRHLADIGAATRTSEWALRRRRGVPLRLSIACDERPCKEEKLCGRHHAADFAASNSRPAPDGFASPAGSLVSSEYSPLSNSRSALTGALGGPPYVLYGFALCFVCQNNLRLDYFIQLDLDDYCHAAMKLTQTVMNPPYQAGPVLSVWRVWGDCL